MQNLYCIACPNGCLMTLIGIPPNMVVEGAKCPNGTEFAKTEMENPMRVLTTTVRTSFPDVPVISVRTDGEIPKKKIPDALEEISKITVTTELTVGDIVLEDVADTEVNVIITSPALTQLGAELENRNAELSRASSSSYDESEAAAGGAYGADGADGAYGGGPGGGAGGFGADGSYGNGNYGEGDGVLDDLGESEDVGGFLGAAGEAVGVEGAHDENDSSGGGGRARYSRPHIKKK